jgi:hypothetical protein
MGDTEKNAFRREAEGRQRGSLAQFCGFLLHNKKWWLTPIIVVLVVVGALVLLGGTGLAPFIYTLF